MKIVGVSACTAGIAHTYITRKRLLDAAEKCGYDCKIETQGSIGPENVLTPEEIAAADVVLIAADIKISGEDRFKGKPMVRCRTADVMKNAAGLLKKIEEALEKRAE